MFGLHTRVWLMIWIRYLLNTHTYVHACVFQYTMYVPTCVHACVCSSCVCVCGGIWEHLRTAHLFRDAGCSTLDTRHKHTCTHVTVRVWHAVRRTLESARGAVATLRWPAAVPAQVSRRQSDHDAACGRVRGPHVASVSVSRGLCVGCRCMWVCGWMACGACVWWCGWQVGCMSASERRGERTLRVDVQRCMHAH